MNLYHKLEKLLPILYPTFYTRIDINQNEFVLLDTGMANKEVISHTIADRTQYEAVENHVHIFEDYIGAKNYDTARKVGISIAENLYNTLTTEFPDKSFVVYLTINLHGMIIRFHQIWDNEPTYYDETMQYDAEIISFHNSLLQKRPAIEIVGEIPSSKMGKDVWS